MTSFLIRVIVWISSRATLERLLFAIKERLAIDGPILILPACRDCRTDVEPYMVFDDIWQKAQMPEKGHLCLPCLERRIGRRLEAHDFNFAPINKNIRHVLRTRS